MRQSYLHEWLLAGPTSLSSSTNVFHYAALIVYRAVNNVHSCQYDAQLCSLPTRRLHAACKRCIVPMLCGALSRSRAHEAGTAGVHCRATVCAKASTGTPALHRLAKVRECCMPYWSRVPQLPSHAATMACARRSQCPPHCTHTWVILCSNHVLAAITCSSMPCMEI